jgi:hypothetical protein
MSFKWRLQSVNKRSEEPAYLIRSYQPLFLLLPPLLHHSLRILESTRLAREERGEPI